MEVNDLVAVRLAMLALILVVGVPGNAVAIILHATAFRQNRLNGILFLHLSCIDFLLCFVHGTIGLVLESVGYFDLNKDFGDWSEILVVLDRNITLQVLYFSVFSSFVTLAMIVFVRLWRVFNPFGRTKTKLVVSFLLLFDLIIIVLQIIRESPKMYLAGFSSDFTIGDDNNTVSDGNTTQFPSNYSFGVDTGNVTSDNIGRGPTKVTEATDGDVTSYVIKVGVVLTLLTIITSYAAICVRLKHHYANMTDCTKAAEFAKRQKRHLITHALLLSVALGTLLPVVVPLIGGFRQSFIQRRLNSTVCVMGSAINPYLYCLLVAANRHRIRAFCRSC